MKNLLTSREFWVSILGLAVILLGQFLPGFKIDIAGAASLVLVIVSYLYGLTQDPGPGGWRGWLASRKFWAAVVGFALIIVDGLKIVLPEGITPDMLIALSAIIGGFIVSVAKQPGPLPKYQIHELEDAPSSNPETPDSE
jgi:uncharacterized membrane protein